MQTYSDLIPRMIADIPGCPTQTINQALQFAGYDFCQETECLYEDLTLSIVADQEDYTLTLTTPQCRIIRIQHVKLKNATTDDFDDITPTDINYYELITDNTLRWNHEKWPTTSLSNGMQVRVIIVPQETAIQLPSWFMNRWYLAIIARAKTILCLQDKKPWTNPNIAMINEQTYARLKGEAKREKYAKYRYGDITVTSLASGAGGF